MLTQRILDKAEAERIEAEAIAGLTPDIHALGVEFGLFGVQVTEVAEEIETAAQRAGRSAGQSLIARARENAGFQQSVAPGTFAAIRAIQDRAAMQDIAAQHGAAVRGSRYGSLVRVGENFTNENIVPVGRGGMGGGGGLAGQAFQLNIRLGDSILKQMVLIGRTEAERTLEWD